MNGFLHVIQLLMLTVSVILQFYAAFFAFRLVRLSRNTRSWILFSIILLLMAIRRSIAFYHLSGGMVNYQPGIYAEIMALLISILLLAGLFSIAPLVRRMYAAKEFPDRTLSDELFDRITSAVAVYETVDKGRGFIIRDVNPAAEQIEKTVRQHMVGCRLTEVFPQIERVGLPDVLQRVWKTGQSERLPPRYYQDERTSGWREYFIYRRSDGKVVAIYADVSSQMHQQEEMDRCQQKFKMLFEQDLRAYQVLDSEGRILQVNPAWLHLTGLDRTSATGRPFSELLTRSSRKGFEAYLDGLKNGKVSSMVELELRQSSGALRNVQLKALFLKGRTDGIEQIPCILREESTPERDLDEESDVERRAHSLAMNLVAGERREIQRQRFTLLGELTAGMAQELNVPLDVARNAFNLMRTDLLPSGRGREFAEIANNSLGRMASLVERMYRFYEPISPDCETIQLNAMLDNALILVRLAIRERRIQVRDERMTDLPALTLPPGAVMPVLVNPITNSIEAMSPGGVLTLRTGMAEQGGVFVEIEDNGLGIPPEFMPRLFDPFTAIRHPGTAKSGAGLGMAAMKQALDALGGSVTVRSAVGEGTCVRIILPTELKNA